MPISFIPCRFIEAQTRTEGQPLEFVGIIRQLFTKKKINLEPDLISQTKINSKLKEELNITYKYLKE